MPPRVYLVYENSIVSSMLQAVEVVAVASEEDAVAAVVGCSIRDLQSMSCHSASSATAARTIWW